MIIYPILAEHIKTNFGSYNKFGGDGTTTFAVPDLRGEFLRGTGTNSHSGQGSGAAVGTHQDGTQNAFGYMACQNQSCFIWSNNSISNGVIEENADALGALGTGHHNVSSAGMGNAKMPGYYITRPTNTSVMYAIRYE